MNLNKTHWNPKIKKKIVKAMGNTYIMHSHMFIIRMNLEDSDTS